MVAKDRVQPRLDFGVSLGGDLRIPQPERVVLADPAADRVGAVKHETRPEEGRVAGLTPRGAQLQLIHAAHGLHEPVGSGSFGKEEVLVRIAIHTRAVGADPNGEQQALVRGQDFFLAVQPQVLHGLLGLGGGDARRLAYVLEPKGDGTPEHVRGVQIALLVLEPRRRGRLEGVRRRRVRVHRTTDEIQPEIGALPEHHRAGLAVLRLELQIRRGQDVVSLAEEIHAAC